METVFECLMLLAFIVAMCVLIYRFAKNKSQNVKIERTVAWTMAVGFVLGVVKELIFPPVRWVLALYAIGEILAYTAAAFSYPYHSDKDKNKEQEDHPLDWEET